MVESCNDVKWPKDLSIERSGKSYGGLSISHIRSILTSFVVSSGIVESVMKESYNVKLWGVQDKRVIIWTGGARILLEVLGDNTSFRNVLVLYFKDRGFHHLTFKYFQFSVYGENLRDLRNALLSKKDRRIDFDIIYEGNHLYLDPDLARK